ncbi:hypothetical protein FRACA_4080004 [Frankia canadensis]|uniref:Uncharacterized protein n=1 Tax=Frankia canadensis TaxID=1836972 RepID=A0A2I2KWS7_9ACTN|nr:hypothetical protein FRACA_4080004 [Frankia canadensis]SOU57411.1 hypothetical protein FRACA_4080004 [Frankia canadensis]
MLGGTRPGLLCGPRPGLLGGNALRGGGYGGSGRRRWHRRRHGADSRSATCATRMAILCATCEKSVAIPRRCRAPVSRERTRWPAPSDGLRGWRAR